MNVNSLFESFKSTYEINTSLADNSGVFIKDGIINNDLFSNSREKTLFIGKEHNLSKKYNEKDYAADYRIWWEEHVHLTFSVRISEWAFGIEDSFFKSYDQISEDDRIKALKSIAFINVKKTAGRATAHSKTICGYINASRSLLQQQILEIAPTLIICGFRYNNYPNHLFEIEMSKSETGTFSYGKWNGIDIINFFHPSSRKNKKWLFAELALAYKYVRP